MVKEDEASYGGSEIETIINHSKADGTYMKAPNGQPTNLNEKQWVQVRTKAFKKWFGDWEKVLRIEKLKKSKPIAVLFSNEYELNRDSAKKWMKDNLRGEYRNADTGDKIVISKIGINEVTAHGSKNVAHLKSLSAIPQMIEQSVFIDEIPNTKGHDKYDSYRYYVCGLKIDGIDYTAKVVVGVKDGNKYYDHRLTEIEKGTLIDNLNGLSNSVVENQNASLTIGKDSKLLSILQTNSSKVVDENGEPMVMYHGTASDITSFDMYDGSLGKGAYFTSSWDEAAEYAMEKQGVDNIDELDESKVMAVFLNVRDEKNITHSRFSREDIEVLATSPTQIKSATENNGEYSGENLDIRYSLRDKPRRKPGASLISYHRRVEEWKTEWEEAKRRREVETMGRNEFDDNKGNRAVTIRKRINGVSVIATIELGENKEFLVTSYQYVRSDALDVSNETPGLNVRNDSDIANVQKEIEEIKSSALNSSKVVDANGEPLVVYHSRASDIKEFSHEYDKTGVGRQIRGG